jgi:hypothetical protein
MHPGGTIVSSGSPRSPLIDRVRPVNPRLKKEKTQHNLLEKEM